MIALAPSDGRIVAGRFELEAQIRRGRALCSEMLDVLEPSRELMELAATQALCAMALAEMGGRGDTDHKGLACTLAEAAACEALRVFSGAPAGLPLVCARLGRILLEGVGVVECETR